jgi:uncharacterized protein YicC (UPF0701 family)
MTMVRRSGRALGLAVVLVVVAAPGCAQKYRAEQDGQDVGEALCDLREADEGEAPQALADLEAEIDDVAEEYAVFTAEDRADITENVSDLAEHVSNGDTTLAQQDLAVIQRSLDNISDDVSDTAHAAIDGVLQGVDDCLNG